MRMVLGRRCRGSDATPRVFYLTTIIYSRTPLLCGLHNIFQMPVSFYYAPPTRLFTRAAIRSLLPLRMRQARPHRQPGCLAPLLASAHLRSTVHTFGLSFARLHLLWGRSTCCCTSSSPRCPQSNWLRLLGRCPGSSAPRSRHCCTILSWCVPLGCTCYWQRPHRTCLRGGNDGNGKATYSQTQERCDDGIVWYAAFKHQQETRASNTTISRANPCGEGE